MRIWPVHPEYLDSKWLVALWREALLANHFDKQKIDHHEKEIRIPAKSGQIDYEFEHLLRKLKSRDVDRYSKYRELKDPQSHFVFQIVTGGLENREKVYNS